ncbi:hypothetical protein AVV39_gp100 [Escherichia phage HY02]|uniref:Phage protein n=1 Tax=Escherichia phage HY02 TaxID=1527531 RepID=A0A0H3UD33_9CAUD|nr:hypothetical protein AVV39_gp100 [Escherichia phage HY02]AIK67911.1 hypothetical protein HY02_100 [Escherichia phage HY02]
MTAHSKLSDSYKREGFTPFFEEKSLNKFQEECLTKIDRFYRMLLMKCDGEVEVKEDFHQSMITVIIALPQHDISWLFIIKENVFEYQVYRRIS